MNSAGYNIPDTVVHVDIRVLEGKRCDADQVPESLSGPSESGNDLKEIRKDTVKATLKVTRSLTSIINADDSKYGSRPRLLRNHNWKP